MTDEQKKGRKFYTEWRSWAKNIYPPPSTLSNSYNRHWDGSSNRNVLSRGYPASRQGERGEREA